MRIHIKSMQGVLLIGLRSIYFTSTRHIESEHESLFPPINYRNLFIETFLTVLTLSLFAIMMVYAEKQYDNETHVHKFYILPE